MNFGRGAAIILMFLLLAGAAQAAITGATIVTNLSSSDRVIMGTNSTFNFTFTESVGTKYTNFTFPSSFNFTGLLQQNVTNNTGSSITVGLSSTMVNLSYTARASGVHYFNFTSKMTAPAASGAYTVNITTNATTTPTSVQICARNASRPYLLSANNSVYTVTCGTPGETFEDGTTTISLSGKGVANITINAPHRIGQTNITKGYGTTNATVLQAVNSSDNTAVVIYVTTDDSVQDPIVVISQPRELQSSNLPAAIVALGGAGALYVLYKYRTRTR